MTYDELTKLGELRDLGTLTEAQFNAERARLVGSCTPSVPKVTPTVPTSTPRVAPARPKAIPSTPKKMTRGKWISLTVVVVVIAAAAAAFASSVQSTSGISQPTLAQACSAVQVVNNYSTGGGDTVGQANVAESTISNYGGTLAAEQSKLIADANNNDNIGTLQELGDMTGYCKSHGH